MAEARPAPAWSLLARLPPHEILTEPRTKLKEQLVKEREDKNIVPKGEAGAEFPWQPLQCEKSHRLVVVRQNLSVQPGEKVLFAAVRYFFHIPNREARRVAEPVEVAPQRCHQANVGAQLKGAAGSHAPAGGMT